MGTDPFSLWHPARFEDFFEPRDAAAARFPSLHALPRPSRSGVRTSQESLGCAEPPAGAWGQRGSLGGAGISDGRPVTLLVCHLLVIENPGWRPWARSAGLGRGSKQRRRGKLESKRTLDMQPPGAL